MYGKIVEINKQTEYGMQVILDNGVSAWISFNPDNIHMSFSGYDYTKGLSIREAELIGVQLKLPNYVTIQYKSREDS